MPYRWKADVLVSGRAEDAARAVLLRLLRGDQVLVEKRGPLASLGALSRRWPVRRRLLGATAPASLEGPVLTLPDDLDGAYFQAAPADQRMDAPRGDERIVIAGAAEEGIDLRLPGARAEAWLYGAIARA